MQVNKNEKLSGYLNLNSGIIISGNNPGEIKLMSPELSKRLIDGGAGLGEVLGAVLGDVKVIL